MRAFFVGRCNIVFDRSDRDIEFFLKTIIFTAGSFYATKSNKECFPVTATSG